ncbi:MAG: hypothetical protein IPN90_08950 [Elusimicrobia bacterium]|nr:hypothetical protein [Elusimicrobiota bacterium]
MDEIRYGRGEATAAKRARAPPVEQELEAAVNSLVTQGLVPRVNDRPLSELVQNPNELLSHFRHYCVLRSPSAILRILQNRLSLMSGSQDSPEMQNQILDLYEGLFEQETYLNRKFSGENPLSVVLFRGGRAASSLTQLLSKDPRIRVNAVVAGSDAGRTHRVPAHDFGMPGVPDMGKALLDLAQSEPMKDFLGTRFQLENGEYNDSIEEEFMRDFEGLTEYLVNQKTDRSSTHLNAWLKKIDGLPEEDRRTLGLFLVHF